MQRVIISGAFAALAYRAAAGVVTRGDDDLSFVDQSWDEVCEGSDWTIKWSKGNGKTTSVKVKGADNWSASIGEAQACPGEIDWTVEVPKCDEEYTLEIQQEECESLESPKFMVACAGEDWEDSEDSNDAEWDDNKPSTVTVVYYEEDCSCTKTKETPAPTHKSLVWYDDELKCSVTIETAAATWADAADPSHTWADAADPSQTWADAADPAHTWADAADPSHTWADASVDPAHTWADAADPSHTWADASVDPAHTWSDAADPAQTWADVADVTTGAQTWGDGPAPAGATTPAAGSAWADNNVAPAEASPAGAAPSWANPAKPVADYTGAASQLTGSFSALAAVFLAALAL